MPPSPENVAIFWDYENCAIPANLTGYEAADAIRRVARGFGSVTMFKAYLEVSEQVSSPRSMSLRSELQASGVSLTDCPHNGRKDVADKMMIVDMLAYAIDNPPPTTFMLISGDRDFSYALSILRLRRYRVALITPPNTHISLTTQASHHLLWTSDVLDISTNTPSKPPKKEPRTPARVLSPPARVNFASATPSSRRNTDTSFARDRAAASPTKGMLAPPTPTDPEQTLVMGEGSKRREPRVRTRLGERGQGGSMPSIIGEEPQSPSPKSSRREPVTVTSFFGTPFRLPRTPPSRFETSSFGQFTDRKGKARESASPQPFAQTPLTARHGLSYLQTRQPTPRSPLVEAVNAPLPQSPLSDVYQEGHGSDSDRPPSSELGAEYEDDIPWESHSRPPSEPLSPRTDFQNSVAPYGDSSNENTDSLMSPPSNAGSPLRNSRMPDGSPKRVVPFRFKPLVLQLQDCRKDGSYIPPRSQLSEKLEARFQPVERIYQNAGVEGFDEYIDLAEQEGFVTTGGGDGPVEAWIMLRQEWVASLC